MVHPAQVEKERLVTECVIRRQRRSGPGGQHRNKVETGIFIHHKPTDIRAEATEKRSQQKNQELAIFRLRLNLAINYRDSSPCEQPSELWQSRVRNEKISINAEHNDFPALLSEALDVLAWLSWDIKPAAEFLRCSASQFVKLLKKEPRALSVLNHQREQRGMSGLK